MPRRVVYVSYLGDRRLQLSIDALRYLAEPGPRRPAHITVRGPYQHPMDADTVEKARRELCAWPIVVQGTGTFFGDKQHTVFYECDSPGLMDAWDKPGLAYHPHLTIYDGGSRKTAEQLKEVLDQEPVAFRVSEPDLVAMWLDERGRRLGPATLTRPEVRGLLAPLPDRPPETWTVEDRLPLVHRLLKGLQTYGVVSPAR
jgi:2'-5' RNA ligase